MNCFIGQLARVCSSRLLSEKWLVAPSLRVGHQWVDGVTLAGVPVVNLRVKTLKRMALELAAPEMAAGGMSLVSSLGATVLVDGILQRLRKDPGTYFASVHAGPTLTRSMQSAVEALRMAGISANRMDTNCFEVARKGADVAFVLSEFDKALKERGLVDYPDILRMASQRLRNDPALIDADTIVLISEDADLTGLEKAFFEAIPDSCRQILPVDRFETGQAPSEKPSDDAALLSWILAPGYAPEASRDGTASMFAAVGECNEVREVLRRCISSGYRLDEVELLHTDRRTYVPLVLETLLRVVPDSRLGDRGLPVTFAEGIPSSYSRPGRALAAWMEWIGNDYPQSVLNRMIREGLLKVPEGHAGLTYTEVAASLRGTLIGFGRDRYLPRLEETVNRLEGASRSHEPRVPDEESSGDAGHQADSEKMAAAGAALDLVTELLEVTPARGCSDASLLKAAVLFLTQCARRVDELDNYAARALVDRMDEMLRWVEQCPGSNDLDIPRWLELVPAEVQVEGSGPRPGCLHVAHVLSGGHSGRKHTFVIGLDDRRFPGTGLNDPLLLDEERGALSEELPRAGTRPRMDAERFARLMARITGNVTLGFSCHNIEEDRPMFPSSLAFSAYRILSNDRESDQDAMLRWLLPVASFAPPESVGCLDESQWWLAELCGTEVSNGSELMAVHFPHLQRGSAAAAARAGDEHTVFDGLLHDIPADLDPLSPSGPVMSATRLETIGRCPLAYYFRYVLKLDPPEEVSVDPDRWLDHLKFGEMLHEVFYQFMTELNRRGELPGFGRHREFMLRIVHEAAKSFEHRYPPCSSSAFNRQVGLLTQAALIFLVEEEIMCRHQTPRFLEVSIGMRPYGKAGPLDSSMPVTLELAPGTLIRARARIDRMDEMEGEPMPIFAIWDYKSGQSTRYESPDPFRQGRTIQSALYMAIAEEALKHKVSPSAAISYFGYFFPGIRGRGRRILRSPRDGREGRRIIERLCRIVSQGCFLATNDVEDCGICDFVDICGDVKAGAQASGLKLANPRNQLLATMRELRNIET